mmetsp:Transcript_12551/g.28341  ORF Transcript_12551/g.28341 Transcript_12551/m.28341 type:complete len:207 (-) Transcript_12551:1198-1818(-)
MWPLYHLLVELLCPHLCLREGLCYKLPQVHDVLDCGLVGATHLQDDPHELFERQCALVVPILCARLEDSISQVHKTDGIDSNILQCLHALPCLQHFSELALRDASIAICVNAHINNPLQRSSHRLYCNHFSFCRCHAGYNLAKDTYEHVHDGDTTHQDKDVDDEAGNGTLGNDGFHQLLRAVHQRSVQEERVHGCEDGLELCVTDR